MNHRVKETLASALAGCDDESLVAMHKDHTAAKADLPEGHPDHDDFDMILGLLAAELGGRGIEGFDADDESLDDQNAAAAEAAFAD